MRTQTGFEVDAQFLNQVYYGAWGGKGIGTIVLGVLYGFPAGVSFAIGGFISLSMLALVDLAVRKTMIPKNSVKKMARVPSMHMTLFSQCVGRRVHSRAKNH